MVLMSVVVGSGQLDRLFLSPSQCQALGSDAEDPEISLSGSSLATEETDSITDSYSLQENPSHSSLSKKKKGCSGSLKMGLGSPFRNGLIQMLTYPVSFFFF